MVMRAVLIFTALLFSHSASAHLLKIFAYSQPIGSDQEALQVRGKVYFAGGAPVANLSLKVVDSNGKITAKPSTDPQGKFAFSLIAGNYQIIADSLDGHVANWQLKAPIQRPKPTAQGAAPVVDDAADRSNLFSKQQLQSVIAEQLALQIQPLTEQLNSLEEKARFQDILGALGYIFGLYGLAIWWQQRKAKRDS